MEASARVDAGVVPFSAVGEVPLRGGIVERLGEGGRGVFARERYSLEGAVPDAELEVRLLVHLFDPTCSNLPVLFASTALRTDERGNGAAVLGVRTEDVPAAVRGAHHGLRWEIRSGDAVIYRTECTPLELNEAGEET